MFARFVAFAFLIGHVSSIVSKEKKGDVEPQESISRDFSYGEDGHYGVHSTGVYGGYDYGGNYEKYYGHEEPKPEHKDHDPAYYKALALKGLLIPLAGVALLGAAAAFVTNPILLQLGVISSTYGRRKRDLSPSGDIHKYRLLERFMAQVPPEEIRRQEERLFANYLRCSGGATEDECLERLACELQSSQGASMPVEKSVMAIITSEILTNKFVSEDLKSRVAKAASRGINGRGCARYKCHHLGNFTRNRK